MPFTYNGHTFSDAEIKEIADEKGMSIESFLETKPGLERINYVEKPPVTEEPKKETEPVATDAATVPENQVQFTPDVASITSGNLPENTDLNLETGSLELPKNDTDPEPKPKTQKEIPQITSDILKDEDEDDVAADVKKWFGENGLKNDFTVMSPSDPFSEKIRITSNQTGESFDYTKDEGTGFGLYGAPTPAVPTSIEELNNWIYQNSRHFKGESQNFYKETNVSITEAPNTVSDESSFDKDTYTQNFKNASLKAEKQVDSLFKTNQFKTYSEFSLLENKEEAQEYIESMYEVLEENGLFQSEDYSYFNEEGKQKIIQKAFDKIIYKKAVDKKTENNILFGEGLKEKGLTQEDKNTVANNITKQNYFLSIQHDDNAKTLYSFAQKEKELQGLLNNQNNTAEQKILYTNQLKKLNKERSTFDTNFVRLADEAGKVTYVNKDNLDETNTQVTNIKSIVDVYSNQYSIFKNNPTGLQTKAAEIGVETYANDKLGETVIPSVTIGGETFTNIKIKDLKEAYYDKEFQKTKLFPEYGFIIDPNKLSFKDAKGNEIKGKINQYYDKKLDLVAQTTAIGELVYLNKSTEKQAPGFFQSVADGFVESLPGKIGEENLTQREKLNLQQSILEEAGVKQTEGMLETSVPTFGEELGTGIGASVIPMAEFVGVNLLTAGVGNVVKSFKTGASVLKWYNGLKNSKSIGAKIVYGVGQAGLEEVKTQIIGLDTGSGAAFSTFHQLAPLNFKKYINPILQKGVGTRGANIVTPVLDNLMGGAVRAGAAMEVAGVVEHVIKDGEIQDYINENFQDIGEVGRRMVIQGASMSWLGAKELFRNRTYYGAKEFAREIYSYDLKIKEANKILKELKDEGKPTSEVEKKIQELKDGKQYVKFEMESQGVARDLSDDAKLAEYLKSEVSKFSVEVAEANSNPNIDFEIKVTNDPTESNGGNSFDITPEGKLKITTKINKAKVTESTTSKKGNKYTFVKNYSTIGHETYHGRNIMEAYKSVLKAEGNNPKKVTKEAVEAKIKNIVKADYNKLSNSAAEFKRRTGIDIKETEAQVKKAYEDKDLSEIEVHEEVLAAIRDKIYNNVSSRKQSILTTKRTINAIKNKFEIKGDTKSVNDFLEIMDRLSNKNKKSKLANDIDVSFDAVSSAKFAGEVVREMEQKDLKSLEKLEREELELELALENDAIDYELYEQKLENIQLKRDKLSRDSSLSTGAKPKASKEKELQIGDTIKNLIPENITKKEYDREYVGDVLTTLTETNMLDGVINNMMSRDGIVSDNVFGRSKQEFINEVKGKGKSNTFLKAILKFNPEQNDNLGGWVINSLRNRYKDALVLFKKQQSESQAKQAEEVKGLSAESQVEAFEELDLSTTGVKQTEAEERSIFDRPTFKERGVINESNEPIIQKGLKNSLTQMLDKTYADAKSKNKRKTGFVTDLLNLLKKDKAGQKEFKKTIPLKEMSTGSNKDAVLENLPTFYLGGKTQANGEVLGGMPFAIEKRVDGKFLKYPDWVGKKIDRESTADGNAGRTSGNEIVRRAPSSSVETIESAFAKRGSDLSFYNQVYGRSVVQELVEIVTKSNPTKTELEIRNIYDAIAENSNIPPELFDAQLKETSIRMQEQRDLPPDQAQALLEKSNSLAQKLLGLPVKDQEELLIKEIPGLTERHAIQIRKSYRAMQNLYNRQTIKKTVKKAREGKKLNKEEAKLFEDLNKTIADKTLSKVEKTELVNSKRQLTAEGKAHVEKGKEYLFGIREVKGNKEKLNFFFSYYTNAIRFNKPKTYINNTSILKLFPQLENIKGLSFGKTTRGYTFTYKGKAPIDPRTSEGKIKALDKKSREIYNKSTKANYKSLKGLIDKAPDYETGNQIITNAFAQNLSVIGANVSKIINIEIGKDGKPIDASTAVFEHNPPRKKIEADFRKYLVGSITEPTLNALAEGYGVNLISKESNTILEKNGFKEKGTAAERVNLLIKKGVKLASIDNVSKDGTLINPSGVVKSMSQLDLPEGALNIEFNKMIERSSGIPSKDVLSDVVARRKGRDRKSFRLFLPPAAEDFRGLYYDLLGKRQQGEADKKFFENNLVKPYAKGISDMEKSKIALSNDYKTLRKTFRPIFKESGVGKLNKDIPGTNITKEQAIRIYLWNKSGFEVPGLTEVDSKAALSFMHENPSLVSYAESLQAISKKSEWSKPSEYWDAQSILTDLSDIALNVNRKEYLDSFIKNKDEIFSKDNLNKLEASYGKKYRESIEDIMYRMETGTNKSFGKGSIADTWNKWVNNSIGSIMFLNRRSASLQLLSTINFVNTGDNNPVKAAAAFANQPQYWKDWAMIFNSAKLKERRGGLKSDVNEAEIAAAAAGSKKNPQAIISYLLQKGFALTSIADSFAIATGGATFYRNRLNTYKKKLNEEGEKMYTEKQAAEKAFEDFSLISDQTQQSGDPMLVSKQQADPIARFVLAFQNTPMQITRFQKRDFQDFKNRRRIEGKTQFQSDATYLSRIGYYAFVQNLMFSTLQNGLYTILPGFDGEDDPQTEKEQKKAEEKVLNTVNSMVDTTLRGSGIYGSVGSTLKNVMLKYYKENQKSDYNKDNAKILLEGLNISPTIGSKARKFYNALNTMDYEKDVIAKRGFDITINNKFQLSPSYQVLGNFSAALANIPLDRITAEVDNITEFLDKRNSVYQRIALGIGAKGWEVGAEIEEHKEIKAEAKKERKEEGKRKIKEAAAKKRQTEKEAISKMSNEELNKYVDWKLNNKGKRLYDYLQEIKK